MSKVLEFFRQEEPRLKDVPDEELTRFISSEYPEFNQDPEFSLLQRADTPSLQTSLRNPLGRPITNKPTALTDLTIGEQRRQLAEAQKAEANGSDVSGQEAFDDPVPALEGLEALFYGASLKGIQENVGKPVMQAFSTAGKLMRAAAVDTMAGNVLPKPGRLIPNLENTAAAVRGQPLPSEPKLVPVQAGIADAFESIPIIAGAVGLSQVGVPAPLAFGGMMGASTLHQTGNTKEALKAAAIGTVLPAAGEFGRRLAGKLLGKAVQSDLLAADSTTAQKMVEAIASQAAAQGVIEVARLPDYAAMPPQERKDAFIRSLAGNLVFGLMELPAFAKGVPSETQRVLRETVADVAAEALPNVDEAAIAALDPRRAQIYMPARQAPGPGVIAIDKGKLTGETPKAGETITGPDEGKASGMPAEPEVSVKPGEAIDQPAGTVGPAGPLSTKSAPEVKAPPDSAPELMTPEQHAAYVVKRNNLDPAHVLGFSPDGMPIIAAGSTSAKTFQSVRSELRDALDAKRPVNADLLDGYNRENPDRPLQLPGGYIKRGNHYEYEPTATSSVTPAPSKPHAPAQPQARLRRREERPWDVLDEIEANIGRIRGLKSAKVGSEGYYGSAYKEAVRLGAVRKLFSNVKGSSPDEVVDALRRSGYRGEDYSVDDLWDDMIAAANGRKALRTTQSSEKRFFKEEQKQKTQFDRVAIQNKRPPDEKQRADAVPVTNLLEGEEFMLAGVLVKVRELIFDDQAELSEVVLEDGPRFGVQRVGAEEIIFADGGSWKQKEGSTEFLPPEMEAPAEAGTPPGPGPDLTLEGNVGREQLEREAAAQRDRERVAQQRLEAERRAQAPLTGSSADVGQGKLFVSESDLFSGPSAEQLSNARSTGGVEASPAPAVTGNELGAGPGGPRARRPAPEDDPEFTAFPVELPEAVRFARDLLGGVYPKVREKLRALRGAAAGVFRHTDGPGGKGEIELRADIADLLTAEEKANLRAEAEDYAKRVAEPGDNVKDIARERYEFLLDQAYREAKRRPPVQALKVLWHEIGHAVDWLPEKLISGRGNILGRIASLKNYLKHSIALDPSKPAGEPIKPADRERLRKEAEAQLREEMGPIREIVETIVTEEPELRIRGVTPEDVKKLFGMSAREEMPELYKWFAEQPAAVKKDIIRKAMKGLLDERLAAMGTAEQVGTKTVERTIRKKVGREPTPEEIQARFKELLRDEVKRRNLAELQQVKTELEGAIAWWHGTEKMPEYFRRSSEMFAEAFSIFMNNPAALQKRAPTFSRLLWNYMDRKPEAAKLYDQIQNEVKAGQAADITEKEMLDSWDRADAQSIEEARRASRTSMRDFLDNVTYHMDRRFGPIYRTARGYAREGQLRQAIGDFLYRASEHELFLNQMNQVVGKPLVGAGLDWKDLGRYLFYKRVVEERFKIFNPYGVAPDRALNRLENMRANLGESRWVAIERAAEQFRGLYDRHVVSIMQEARLWSPELQRLIDSNVHYATFDVRRDTPKDGIASLLDSTFGANTTPHIYRQIGTVKEIKNPATATVLKALSLISASHRNIAKRETVQMLLGNDPANIVPAERRWTGKRWEHVIKDGDNVGTVVYLEQGKPQAYYVRKVVADALNKTNSIDNRLTLAAVKATSGLKALFTQLNYAFWPVNFVRDTVGWVMQMPGALTPIAWWKYAPKALAAARASVKGTPNRAAEAALQRKMVISRADPHGIWSAAENEYEVRLASYGLEPAQWAKEADRVHRVVKAWNVYREVGQTFERVNKIAGMLYLDEKFPSMPEWKKREIVRERSGSPNFLERGASNPYVDFFMMFYNPWKEAIRSVSKSARENPWSFAAKTTGFVVLPTVLQGLAAAGAMGDEMKKRYRSIPDYDLTNYLVIPIGWQDETQGTVAYLRLPLWEPARILHGSLWQTITGRGHGYLSFWGGTMPGMNSLLDVANDWVQFEVFGHNPYDAHRGIGVLDDTTFQAGGWPARQELLKQAWNKLGGSIAFRFQNRQLESPPQSTVEKFLAAPIINNALGRWIKVSNRGLDDADRQLAEPIQQQRAQLRLAVRGIIEKLLANESLNNSERVALREPYAMEYLMRTLPEVAAGRQSNLLRRLNNAPSTEARDAILQNATSTLDR